MQRIILSLFTLIFFLSAFAENKDMISLGTYVSNSPQTIPNEAASILDSRLKKVVVSDGFGDNNATGRFALVAKCNILEKDITPTTPVRISQKIEISFVVVDIIENKIYGSCEMTVAGIGTNETKAFSTAFQKVSGQNQQLKNMLAESKDKILDYYRTSCSQILTKANALAANQEYDEAIFILMSVPNISQDCYNDCHQLATKIYQSKVDSENTQLLMKAQNKWAVSPNADTALEVADIISEIDPRFTNYSEVVVLRQTIANKLAADEQYRRERQLQKEAEIAAEKQREWDFKIKQYEDNMKFKSSIVDGCQSVAEKFIDVFPWGQLKIFK